MTTPPNTPRTAARSPAAAGPPRVARALPAGPALGHRPGDAAAARSGPLGQAGDTRAGERRAHPAQGAAGLPLAAAAAGRQARPPEDARRPVELSAAAARPPTAGRRRVLVLRALGLGDLLAGVPALRGLRRAFAGYDIVLAAPEGLREAVAATGAVDHLLPTRAAGRGVPTLRGWAGAPPEVAVDLHGNGPESRQALAALRPGRLLAFAGPHGAGEPAPRWRRDEHERERWCRFLGAYGIAADPADLRLPPPSRPSPAPGAVVVHPGANAAARRWPAARYAEVVTALLAAGRRVVVSGGPGDEEAVAEVAGRAGLAARDVFEGLPFARFSALVAHAAAFVSADTGPAHLAVAHGTPSVTLFGPVDPRLWGPPPDDPRHTLLWHPGPPGAPNGDTPDPLLLLIRPADVVTAVTTRLAPAGARAEEAFGVR